jgi:hypothetical protein
LFTTRRGFLILLTRRHFYNSVRSPSFRSNFSKISYNDGNFLFRFVYFQFLHNLLDSYVFNYLVTDFGTDFSLMISFYGFPRARVVIISRTCILLISYGTISNDLTWKSMPSPFSRPTARPHRCAWTRPPSLTPSCYACSITGRQATIGETNSIASIASPSLCPTCFDSVTVAWSAITTVRSAGGSPFPSQYMLIHNLPQ